MVRIESPLSDPQADIVQYLTAALSTDLTIALYIGPPRAVQKPIVQVLTPDGETFGFAKIGTNRLTRALVDGEAKSLAFLSTARLPHLTVPFLLHHGTWRGHSVLVQRSLAGGAGEPTDSGLLGMAMVELAHVSGVEEHRLAASPFWLELRRRASALEPSAYASALCAALDEIEETSGSVRLRFGSWHGDWAPWNMSTSGGKVLLWDWEHFKIGVPLGLDAVHFTIQSAVVQRQREPQEAFHDAHVEAPRTLRHFEVDDEAARLTVLLYLIDIATRYLHDGEMEANTRLGNLDSWLLPTLARRIADGDRSTA